THVLWVPPPPSPTPVFWNQRLRMAAPARSLSLKDLRIKYLRTNELRDPFPFDCAQGQDFGSGLPPSTALRVTPAKRLKLSCQRALKMGLGQFRGPSGRRAHSTLPQSDVYYLSSRPTNLKSTDFDRGCLWVRVARTLPSISL